MVTVLSAQSIRRLSVGIARPLISPFTERGVVRGRSFGLGPCSYDVRTAGDILLPIWQGRLAVTLERFDLPADVCGQVLDKSTHARVFVSAFNTHLDPGWCGYLTVELVNLGTEVAEWRAGDPLCQVRFDRLDEPTEAPYDGKYQDQPMWPVPGRLESADEALFRHLVERWHRERGATSSVEQIVRCSSYQRIIGLGRHVAVPLILKDLAEKLDEPDHWFLALRTLTGEDPVPEDARGNMGRMARTWLAWGWRNGHFRNRPRSPEDGP